MTAYRHLKLALRALRACRSHLRSAREYARAVRLDERVLVRLQSLSAEERALLPLVDEADTAEAARRVARRRAVTP